MKKKSRKMSLEEIARRLDMLASDAKKARRIIVQVIRSRARRSTRRKAH